MDFRITALGGDGVGPEVVDEALKVLNAAGMRFDHRFNIRNGLIGNAAHDATGVGFPEETRKLCEESDAVILGAVGDPPGTQALGDLRRYFNCSCNVRSIKVYPPLINVGPVKASAKAQGVDFLIIRNTSARSGAGNLENTADGRHRIQGSFSVTDSDVEQTILPAFELARNRGKRIHLVGYGFVGAGALWRAVFDEVGASYPDVEKLYILPDNCNQLVVRDPWQFDVLVFDDLLRAGMVVDVGAQVAGSLGLSPSAEMRPNVDADGRVVPALNRVFGIYEPSHGTVQHRVGKNQVNPIATILCAVDMLRYSCGLPEVADAIEQSMVSVVTAGYRTYDIMEAGTTLVSCSEMGDRIAAAVSAWPAVRP